MSTHYIVVPYVRSVSLKAEAPDVVELDEVRVTCHCERPHSEDCSSAAVRVAERQHRCQQTGWLYGKSA